MASIWNSALNILARRDHSRYELYKKLSNKFPEDEAEVESVLDRLIEQGLQNDEHFCEMWLRYQVNKSRGPVRIRMEAKQKGVESSIKAMIQDSDVDWFELALNCGRKKFPAGISLESKAKAYRFLSYRGYENESVQYAIKELLIKN
jgi:regulatory protein